MNSGDFETKLDAALHRLEEGGAPQRPIGGILEIEDLVLVARRLHVLAPAPMPDLANGRTKFLAQAADAAAQPRAPRRWFFLDDRFRVLAYAKGAVIMLLVGVIIALLASSLAAGIPGTSSWWFSSTPTMRPTYTATPTQISLVSDNASQIRSGWISQIDSRVFLPSPNPAPQAEASRRTVR